MSTPLGLLLIGSTWLLAAALIRPVAARAPATATWPLVALLSLGSLGSVVAVVFA